MSNKLKYIILVVFILAGYWRGFHGYFQQDEWAVFGRMMLIQKTGFHELFNYIFAPSLFHYLPLTRLVNYFSFATFGLNYNLYYFSGLLLHILAVFLVFIFAKKLYKQDVLAFLAALVFGVLFAAYQAVSWTLVNYSTLGATIFGLLSAIYFVDYLNNTDSLKNLRKSVIFFLASLLFKEIAIGLILVYPFLLFLEVRPVKRNSEFKKFAINFGTIFILYIIFRFVFYVLRGQGSDIQFGGESSFSLDIQNVFYNFVNIGPKTFSQSLLPPQILRDYYELIINKFFTNNVPVKGTLEYDKFIVNSVYDLISWVSTVVVLLFSFILIRIRKIRDINIVFVFSIFWIIVNGFIFILSPEKSGRITAVDSRNLYFTGIGFSLFIVSFFKLVFSKKRNYLIVVIVLLALVNIYFLNILFKQLNLEAKVRQNIINKVKLDHQVLPEKVIFYTESNSSYFGLSENQHLLPFQSGFGQVLLVNYENSVKFPSAFYGNRFLWDIDSVGYLELENRGFGYFRDFYDLARAINDNNLPVDSVLAYRFDSNTRDLTEISDEIRGRLEGYNSQKKLIDLANVKISSSINNEYLFLIKDGDIQTYWDTGVPYSTLHFIELSLDKNREIAQIVINSGDNKDQNKVGYKVETSLDGENWKQMFYSKLYPPDSNGKVSLFIKPEAVRYVKISQIGKHKYATWVIHELELYAAD